LLLEFFLEFSWGGAGEVGAAGPETKRKLRRFCGVAEAVFRDEAALPDGCRRRRRAAFSIRGGERGFGETLAYVGFACAGNL
jgi:hypothetical protein